MPDLARCRLQCATQAHMSNSQNKPVIGIRGSGMAMCADYQYNRCTPGACRWEPCQWFSDVAPGRWLRGRGGCVDGCAAAEAHAERLRGAGPPAGRGTTCVQRS